MSEINYQALRMAAENATPGEWCSDDYYGVIADAGLNANYYIASCSGPDNRANKRFIAAANPATVLAVLDEREAQSKRIAELEANLAALAAENAGLKAICDDRRRFIMNGVQMGYIKVPTAETAPDLETIRIAISPQKPIPATDAFLAEVRAQGVEMIREHPSIKLCSLTHICDELAAQLRKGELHMMFDAGIHIKGEEHGNKTRR